MAVVHDFLLCFVPLFVAVDAIGVLPIYLGLVEGVDPTRRAKIVRQSVWTAAIVAVVFTLVGVQVLTFLGITVNDFMVAGGLLLLLIAAGDLLSGEKLQRKVDASTIGAVPIGVPLITGPGVLATCLLLSNLHGPVLTIAAVVLNVGLAGLIFLGAGPIRRALGEAGTRTVSKIASVLLAAIAVMMIRRGITAFVVGVQATAGGG